MNPSRLRVQGYTRFPELDLEIPLGTVALVGQNGAGKSRLLNAIEICLFAGVDKRGPASDLEPWLGPWSDRMELELEFEHAGATYRIRRGLKRNGSPTFDFEQSVEGSWQPVARENVKATQALVDETLGLSRRTFRASSFLAQGDAGAFTEASAIDRKAVVGEVCDPRQLWPRLTSIVKERGKAIDTTLASDLYRIDDREEIVGGIPDLEEAELLAAGDVATATADLTLAETTLTEAQSAAAANAAAYERHRAAEQGVTAAEQITAGASAALTNAKAQADQLEPARVTLDQLTAVAATVPDLEAKLEEQRAKVLEASEARRTRTEAMAAADRQRSSVTKLIQDRAALAARRDGAAERLTHLEGAEDGSERCDRCEQILGGEARQIALRNLQAEVDAIVDETVTADTAIDEAQALLEDLDDACRAIVVPEIPQALDGIDAQLRTARAAAESRQAVAARIEQYETEAMRLPPLTAALQAAEGDLTAKRAVLAQAADEMGDNLALDQAVREATHGVATARNALTAFQAGQTRAAERLTQARVAETELAEIRSRTETAQRSLDLLKLAERAYGRDGIPVLLVENVIPLIEAEANRILEQMPTSDGVVFTVELRTQRALKSDPAAVRETLDILASDPDGDRPYETFSGGERARLNIALRIALARLLAGRRGAESRLLAIDELEYLDALGQEQLVDVVRGVSSDFDRVLIVSHADVVRDAFDSVIEISKRDGVSAVAGARELEAVPA